MDAEDKKVLQRMLTGLTSARRGPYREPGNRKIKALRAALDRIATLEAERDALRVALSGLVDRMDHHMGDTDPFDPDDPDLLAMRAAATALTPSPEVRHGD